MKQADFHETAQRKANLALISILSLSLMWCLPAQAGAEQGLIKIGVIAPLTGSNASRGVEITRTLKAFSEAISKEPNRYRYEFKIEDGKCGLGNSAHSAAQKFIELDHVGFMLTACSGETLQAGLLAQRRQVVVIGVLASDPAVRDVGDFVFRTYLDIGNGIRAISRRMLEDTGGPVAVVTEDLPFTQSIKQILDEELGEKIVFSEDFPSDTEDFASLLTLAKSRRPKAIYLNCGGPKPASALVNRLRSLGMNQPLYSYFMPAEESFLKAVGGNAEGIVFVDVPEVKSTSLAYARFLEFYRAKHPKGPEIDFLARTTHDAAMMLVSAIEAKGPDSSAVRDYLLRESFEGGLGRVRFDKHGDIEGVDFVLKQIRQGKPVSLSSNP